jgi:hypothetical protein
LNLVEFETHTHGTHGRRKAFSFETVMPVTLLSIYRISLPLIGRCPS